ncbi:hypothetical protein [Sphingomonas sp. Leaf21]|jgi:hypothetical protein|uniref:hypothetical protein n=1 Tax=Sphingomonas sp. Leaf21 TaxID=2876550 RepID=UPI001E2B1C48|nr:hypothetical protein [Sphingomonas sp. Leaf21]
MSNISAKHLREQISEAYGRHNGFVVLTNIQTSQRCSYEAEMPINRLGFASVIVKLAQGGDSSPGIP